MGRTRRTPEEGSPRPVSDVLPVRRGDQHDVSAPSPVAGILGLQREAGNAAVTRMLQRQADIAIADTNGSERLSAAEVLKDLADDHPGFDGVFQDWACAKAEDGIKKYWQPRPVMLYHPSEYKTWKKPSKWGEMDVDMFYVLAPADPTKVDPSSFKEPPRQAKVVAHFRRSTEDRGGWHIGTRKRDLTVTVRLIDWLEGHPIVHREWSGLIRVEGVSFPKIEDGPDSSAAPPGAPTPDKHPQKGTPT